jgi:nicotinamide phosphoribosyltransferase
MEGVNKMNTTNILLQTDSYKLSHWNQYPPKTERIYSYIMPRYSKYPVVILGINKYISLISKKLSRQSVKELKEFSELHGVEFNEAGFEMLMRKYKYLPLRVAGVPEGTIVEPGKPVYSQENLDEDLPWLTSYFESLFLRSIWYPSTVASLSHYCKSRIKEFMVRTGADMETLPFKLHDFGLRGATSSEASAVGGAAHLTQFLGTDNLEALKYVKDNFDVSCAGFSIPATEHSTVTSWGRAFERDMYKDFIKKNLTDGKTGACVSDSYNIWEAIKMWKSLEEDIIDSGGTLVIRPDSGDPVLTPVQVIEKLMTEFGFIWNKKGFRVLPPYIRVIQGDGVDETSIVRIMQMLVDSKISLDNIAFGMGGGLLQKVTRDTCGFAMKCSAAKVDGVWRDVYKDPIGGSKTSIKGLVHLKGVTKYGEEQVYSDDWVLYYETGKVFHTDSWEDICKRAEVDNIPL